MLLAHPTGGGRVRGRPRARARRRSRIARRCRRSGAPAPGRHRRGRWPPGSARSRNAHPRKSRVALGSGRAGTADRAALLPGLFRGYAGGAEQPQPVCEDRFLRGNSPRLTRAPSPRRPGLPRAGSPPPPPLSASPADSCRGRLPAGCGERTDALVLMLSELATNAVQHAATEFEVAVRVSSDCRHVRVEVSDSAPGYPTLQEAATDAPHGRGLSIVRSLAEAWGVEMRRDRPGKTVWFSLPLGSHAASDMTPGTYADEHVVAAPAPDATVGGAPVPVPGSAAAGAEPGWPVPGVRAVLDGLRDAVVATDQGGEIRYVNTAAEQLLGWPRGSLVGRPVVDLVPESLTALVGDDFDAFVRSQAEELVGRRLSAVIKRADGSDVDTELVISIFDHPLAGRVVVGIFRPRDESKLQRWSELTSELLEIFGRRADRRASGRAAPLDTGAPSRLGRDDALGPLGESGAGVPACVDARAEYCAGLRAGEGGRPDEWERRPPPLGHGARRAPVGVRSHDGPALHDGCAGQGRAAERLRVPGPPPRGVRRAREDAEPTPARARPFGRGADGCRRRPPGRAAPRVVASGRTRAAGRGAARGPSP